MGQYKKIAIRRQDLLVRFKNLVLSLRLNYLGIVAGTLGYFAALLPSLLPRPEVFMGLLAGLGFAIGYGVGVLLSFCIRWLGVPELPREFKQIAWQVLGIFMVVFAVALGTEAFRWQNEVRQLITEEPLYSKSVLVVIVVSIITIAGAIFLSRRVRMLARFTHHYVAKVGIFPRRIVTLLSIVIVGGILWLGFNGVLFKTFIAVSNRIFSQNNERTEAGVTQPTTNLRSGSSESLVSWDSLGRQGRNFTGRGPTVSDIAEFTGMSAKQPIRVYVGLESEDTPEDRARMAVLELERTKAFERKTLVVMIPTGSGWIEPQAADSIEYIQGGDTALVSMQYSYLPSWISLLANRSDATEAGRQLFDAVYDAWKEKPAESRPKLLVYGLSLGAFGSQAAFGSEADLAFRTDGALFVGGPNFTPLWRDFTEHRDNGSPEYRPVYRGERVVRFANTNDDIIANQAAWGGRETAKVLYVQHPSDPIVWWSPDIILNKPDWLRESRAYDVSSNTRWFPFVTFLQLSVDQIFGVEVPNGFGHNYPSTIVRSWMLLVPPDKTWDESKTQALQDKMNEY